MKKKKINRKKLKLLILPLSYLFLSVNFILTKVDVGLEYGAKTGLGGKDFREIVANILNTAISFLGIIAVIMILYGGFMWMIAGGDEEKVISAKQTFISGIIGLIIVLFSFVLAKFVLSSLIVATGGTSHLPISN